MRISILLGTLLSTLVLTSCVNNRTVKSVPQKTFQYAYQGPLRVQTSPGFSTQLSTGEVGSTIKVKLDNNQLSTARLGRNYYSASGHSCRKYTLPPSFEYAACKVNGHWYQTSPIILHKQTK